MFSDLGDGRQFGIIRRKRGKRLSLEAAKPPRLTASNSTSLSCCTICWQCRDYLLSSRRSHRVRKKYAPKKKSDKSEKKEGEV